MKNFRKSFLLLWSTNKFVLITIILIYLLMAVIPSLKLVITNKLINEILSIQANNNGVEESIRLLILEFIILGSGLILSHVKNYLDVKMEYELEYEVEKSLINLTKEIPYELYEQHNFYDHMSRISTGNISNKIFMSVNSCFSIVSSFIALISVIGLLFQVHFVIVLLSLISFLPFYYFNMKFGNQTYSLMRFQTPFFRKIAYLRNIMYDKHSIKEVRLFNLYTYLSQKWESFFSKNMSEVLHLKRKQEAAKFFLSFFKTSIYSIASLFMLFLMLNKKAKIGDFVMTIQAFEQVQGQSASIAMDIATVYSNLYYINDYYSFIDKINSLDKKNYISSKNVKIDSIEKIEFINVTYTYPDSERVVLSNVSFQINKGESLAIVGENGSGKTTLIHCLLGLYQVKSGQIKINGIDIQNLHLEEYQQFFTVIFQAFMKYAFSLKENIVLDDINNTDESKYNLALIKSETKKIVQILPNGEDTVLGKVYEEGEDLSGGQWQKLAIARSIYRDAEVIVLDEPTAALDPLSEIKVFEQYAELTKGKISIYISHRLGYTKNVDKIIVMKDGVIVESGNHKSLMENKNEYYTMYNAQAEFFADINNHRT